MPPISAAYQEPYEDNMDPEIHDPVPGERQKCPVCGNSWPEKLYVDDWGTVVGCDECISVRYLD
jgi:hypothetical protein